ncbi:MAG TPA: PAS domain S-box protein, partial [Gemmatimonadales bacterium]|nr:PAS domain S-box protein [Gemmatimonadales bacterium]
MPDKVWQEISPGQLWRRGRIRLAIIPPSLVTFLLIGLVALLTSTLSLVLTSGTASSVLALQLFGTIGLTCLAVAQWRALWQANAASRDSLARADRLERELAKHEYLEEAWPHREDRYRTPLEQAQDYTIFLLDVDGRATSWNPGVQRVIGYEREEFLQTVIRDLYTEEDRGEDAPARELREAAERGRTASDRWVVRKDGSRFWGSTSTAGVHDRRGRLLGYARRVRDLSRSKQVE